MNDIQIKNHLLKAGVKNLKEFGYPSVDPSNILTDIVYKEFFKSMLLDNKGKAGDQVDKIIDDLLKEIQ